MKELIADIQKALTEFQVPAWLFYGFRDLDPIALRILRFRGDFHGTRRWFYLVPARGEPVKLVHRIESAALDHLPGLKEVYLHWEQLHSQLAAILRDLPAVAMQYSENNTIPYVSRVDAGTVELVRSSQTNVISSGDLIQRFESVWTEAQLQQHLASAQVLTSIAAAAFEKAADEIRRRDESSERAIQEFILKRFREEGWVTSSPPIVAVNENSADPHYQPSEESYSKISKGDFLLIDLWAKPDDRNGVYADITWTGFLGEVVPQQHGEIFDVVRRARDQGVEFLRQRMKAGNPPQGWEVDDAVRALVREAGYGEYFVHRTGHNLGREVHGNGVNFDNLETHDTRRVIPEITCTIEPGVYLENFGVRSELNVYIAEDGPQVTTPLQEEILTFKI